MDIKKRFEEGQRLSEEYQRKNEINDGWIWRHMKQHNKNKCGHLFVLRNGKRICVHCGKLDFTQLKPGDQIAYIPSHANRLLNHPDVEYGFVVKENPNDPGIFFCRYWQPKRYWKKSGEPVLRTLANSEGTDERQLQRVEYVGQVWVRKAWSLYVISASGDPMPKDF